jgi:hypothetical protein
MITLTITIWSSEKGTDVTSVAEMQGDISHDVLNCFNDINEGAKAGFLKFVKSGPKSGTMVEGAPVKAVDKRRR